MDPSCLFTTVQAGGGGVMVWGMFYWHTLGTLVPIGHDNEFTVLKWTPKSPDLNPIEHLWDVVERELCALDVHPTNLHQLQGIILSIWANISKECFQHLVEPMLHRIKAVLKMKGGQTQYQGVPIILRVSSIYMEIIYLKSIYLSVN